MEIKGFSNQIKNFYSNKTDHEDAKNPSLSRENLQATAKELAPLNQQNMTYHKDIEHAANLNFNFTGGGGTGCNELSLNEGAALNTLPIEGLLLFREKKV